MWLSVKYKYYFYLLTMHPRKITHMMKTWIKWDTRLVFKMLQILKPKLLRPVNPSSLIWNCWSQKRQSSDCSTQRSTIFDILFLIKWFKLKNVCKWSLCCYLFICLLALCSQCLQCSQASGASQLFSVGDPTLFGISTLPLKSQLSTSSNLYLSSQLSFETNVIFRYFVIIS